MIASLLIASIFSLSVVQLLLPRILLFSLQKRLIDPIDNRKVHSVAASRLGGISFFPAIFLSVWLCYIVSQIASNVLFQNMDIDYRLAFLTIAFMMLFLVGMYDDLFNVSPLEKFAIQIIAALLTVAAGAYFKTGNGLFEIYEIPQWLGIILTIGFYVFVTNAINLIDGIDGLASMLSILALIVYSILLIQNGYFLYSMLAATTLGALLPFWRSNVFGIKRKATSKIFMGDSGSLVIGAILGLLAVQVWNIPLLYAEEDTSNLYSILAYTMLLVPCFDVLRVMLHRYRDKKPIFQPDKNHIHHKFLALKMSPRKSLVVIVCISLSFLALNLLLSLVLNLIFIIVIDIIVWSYLHRFISKKIKQRCKNES